MVGALAGGLWLAMRINTTGSDQTVGLPDDPGIVHVHGMGVNPADDLLYVATHTGLFRLSPDGEALRVADRYQDTMGFTVAGPDRFLASGHPGLDDAELRVEGKPPLLGLIESSDAGRTWESSGVGAPPETVAVDWGGDGLWAGSARGELARYANGGWESIRRFDGPIEAVEASDQGVYVSVQGEGIFRSSDGGNRWVHIYRSP